MCSYCASSQIYPHCLLDSFALVYKILLLACKALHDLAPLFVSDLLIKYEPFLKSTSHLVASRAKIKIWWNCFYVFMIPAAAVLYQVALVVIYWKLSLSTPFFVHFFTWDLLIEPVDKKLVEYATDPMKMATSQLTNHRIKMVIKTITKLLLHYYYNLSV